VTATARAALVAVAVVVADQAVKALVRSSIDRGDAVDLILGIKFVNVRNSGIAFGAFAGGGALLVIFALVALTALLVFFFRHRDRPLVWLPTGMLLGAKVSLSDWWLWNQIPVTLGNLVGGFVFTGHALYATYKPATPTADVAQVAVQAAE